MDESDKKECCEFCEIRKNDANFMLKLLKGDTTPSLHICRCHIKKDKDD